MLKFPHNFFWGAATSSHQVEGNNKNNDWWHWEASGKLKYASGEACRHYTLYKEDFDLAKSLNHNAHRLSIEWSRIEPQEGVFNQNEIEHYKQVIDALRERSLEPIVTLHHFTNPLWFFNDGSWCNKKTVSRFLRFVSVITEALADKVNYWVTINEPVVFLTHSYLMGVWPPQEKSIFKALKVFDNLLAVHRESYWLIKDIYKKKNLSAPLISIAKNVQAFEACCPNLKNKLAVYLRDKFYNFEFVDRLYRSKTLDFIGLNYYSRNLAELDKFSFGGLFMDNCKRNHSSLKKNSMGWDIYPQGLYKVLLRFNKYKLPLFILENGICIDDDAIRWEFIREHLMSVHKAMQQGVAVLGYIYWSLMDNFEWDKGFAPRFGLIDVDYKSFKRAVRESAKKFAQVCKTGELV